MKDFDAINFSPSATWEENSVFPNIETGFASKPHLNSFDVEMFSNQIFDEDRNEGAILKIKFYIPSDSIFQLLPVKRKVRNS